MDIFEYAQQLQTLGAGEIFLNCISRDGMMQGYDLNTAFKISSIVDIPVVVCGGAGNYQHLRDALIGDSKLDVACSSLFHFGDNNPIRARSYLQNEGILMRRLK